MVKNITVDIELDRETKIKEIIGKIRVAEQSGSYENINQNLLDKRIKWFDKNKDLLELIDGSDLKKAFEFIFIKYMGIDRKEIPIVHESDHKIVWHSYNWCPVLEACKRLDINTAKVCKNGWEESIGEMAKMINHKISFSRNYIKIRPNSNYCEEMFELIN